MIPDKQIRLLADRMVSWQTPYGRPDPATCPFIETGTLVNSMNFHSPTFMAIGLYMAHDIVGESSYKEAADRYITAYLACLRNPQHRPDFYTQTWLKHVEKNGAVTPEIRQWAINILTWPFIYGMALAAYRCFREHNPYELAMESMASAIYEWLQHWRWDEGSYYRVGYGYLQRCVIDMGNSDDLCHVGRGLIGYHRTTGRRDALADAEALAKYFLNEFKPGTYEGCWSSQLGTWLINPTTIEGSEHFSSGKGCEKAWGFSSVGSIEYLTELGAVSKDQHLRTQIAQKCASSMKWHFDACQFDDGALGMREQDDRWLGMTAGAIMSFIRVRDAGFLSAQDASTYGNRARAAREWLLKHVTPDAIDSGGYLNVTGQSAPKPLDNLAWLFGLTLQGLCMLGRL
ncbi:hypothetical protein JXJ21_26010 [candidate division KSB1 bacterium]|nr:hypothetical protein [candidate division KSB1 bacterium]